MNLCKYKTCNAKLLCGVDRTENGRSATLNVETRRRSLLGDSRRDSGCYIVGFPRNVGIHFKEVGTAQETVLD